MNLPEHKDVPKPKSLPVRLQVSSIDYDDKGLFIELRKDEERFEFRIPGVEKHDRRSLRPVELVASYMKWHGKKGLFHGFFHYADGDDESAIAVVELDDGTVLEVGAECIRFLDRITLTKEEEDETN